VEDVQQHQLPLRLSPSGPESNRAPRPRDDDGFDPRRTPATGNIGQGTVNNVVDKILFQTDASEW